MRDAIIKDLSAAIDPRIAGALVGSYEKLVSSSRRGDLDGCLTTAGLFVEHALRKVEAFLKVRPRKKETTMGTGFGALGPRGKTGATRLDTGGAGIGRSS